VADIGFKGKKYMKKIILVIIAIMALPTAFAGEIRNKTTGESIAFTWNNEILLIDGSKAGIPSRSLKAEEVNSAIASSVNNHNKILYPLLGLTGDTIDYGINDPGPNSGLSVLLFPATIPLALAMDIVTMPVRAPIHLAKFVHSQKDLELIRKVIASDIDVVINDHRFNRMRTYLF
jgi:hypothetical protein